MSKSMLRRFQVQYGPSDGMYWYAVKLWESKEGIVPPSVTEPHRVHSEVNLEEGYVILRDVYDEEIIRVEVSSAKPRKRTTKRKSKPVDSKPEQLEDSSD